MVSVCTVRSQMYRVNGRSSAIPQERNGYRRGSSRTRPNGCVDPDILVLGGATVLPGTILASDLVGNGSLAQDK